MHNFREIAERVKRGVWEAGGFPVEFPVTSLGETNIRPTAMLLRNLVSMDVEESITRKPDRWRRSALRMRQDDAGPDHGRRELRSAHHRRLRPAPC